MHRGQAGGCERAHKAVPAVGAHAGRRAGATGSPMSPSATRQPHQLAVDAHNLAGGLVLCLQGGWSPKQGRGTQSAASLPFSGVVGTREHLHDCHTEKPLPRRRCFTPARHLAQQGLGLGGGEAGVAVELHHAAPRLLQLLLRRR